MVYFIIYYIGLLYNFGRILLYNKTVIHPNLKVTNSFSNLKNLFYSSYWTVSKK